MVSESPLDSPPVPSHSSDGCRPKPGSDGHRPGVAPDGEKRKGANGKSNGQPSSGALLGRPPSEACLGRGTVRGLPRTVTSFFFFFFSKEKGCPRDQRTATARSSHGRLSTVREEARTAVNRPRVNSDGFNRPGLAPDGMVSRTGREIS
jgi:hypothetical protein